MVDNTMSLERLGSDSFRESKDDPPEQKLEEMSLLLREAIELAAVRAANHAAARVRAATTEELKEMRKQLRFKEDELSKLRKQLETETGQKDKLRLQIKAKEVEILGLREEIKSNEDTINNLQLLVGEAERAGRLQKENENLKMKNRRMDIDLKEHRKKLQEAKENMQAAIEAAVKPLEDKLKKKDVNNARMQQSMAKLRAENYRMKAVDNSKVISE